MPEGTPGFIHASGTVTTCTAQGFIFAIFFLAVPTYYGSLILQAYMGIRNNFQEEKYRWIEKWVHIIAYTLPTALAIVGVVTENFNPNAGGCSLTKYPPGCDSDPDVECLRGEDIDLVIYIIGFTQIFLYFIYPPSVMIAMWCWLRNMQQKMDHRGSTGMQQVRDAARKEMMRSIAIQLSLYLSCFWITFMPTLLVFLLQTLIGEMFYGLQIFANCVFAFQGFIFVVEYFLLQRYFGKPKVEVEQLRNSAFCSKAKRGRISTTGRLSTTVQDIRSNAERTTERTTETSCGEAINEFRRMSHSFNIFDGTPDADSPWARFFEDETEDDDIEEAADEGNHHEQIE